MLLVSMPCKWAWTGLVSGNFWRFLLNWCNEYLLENFIGGDFNRCVGNHGGFENVHGKYVFRNKNVAGKTIWILLLPMTKF